ncbi:MAG TPA: response regulator, partial [Myxococcota bacterium]|nr:response regulator [Myxococcota bacterium]
MPPSLRVLVVDDEENIRHMLKLVLTRAGYQVLGAPNGRDALPLVRGADVVLCDMRMPEMDGLTFLGQLPPEAPPVIMMSAYGGTEAALEAVRRGAYDYI